MSSLAWHVGQGNMGNEAETAIIATGTWNRDGEVWDVVAVIEDDEAPDTPEHWRTVLLAQGAFQERDDETDGVDPGLDAYLAEMEADGEAMDWEAFDEEIGYSESTQPYLW